MAMKSTMTNDKLGLIISQINEVYSLNKVSFSQALREINSQDNLLDNETTTLNQGVLGKKGGNYII
jgi:hypothetical protein